jgi:NAD(P)-dependent dehydrogenase (short-subunit alcohol dehydrogenase family)
MMKSFSGKTAFVTGGASGIGLAMTESFLANGMSVVVADIREDHLTEARHRLEEGSSRVHYICLDVSNRQAMAAAAVEAEKVFGPVHVLCNNAGVGDSAPIDIAGYADWDWVLGVNLGSVINGVVEFVPRMKAHGQGGHIVNTASIHSFLALPAWGGIYSTTKFAVRGLSESLRLALAPFNIGVSVVCPGLVRTNIADSIKLAPRPQSTSRVSDQRHSTAQISPPPEGAGMDPATVAEYVIEAIQRNQFYVFTHAEHATELRELFNEALDAVPSSQVPDSGRMAFELERRQKTASAKTLMELSGSR